MWFVLFCLFAALAVGAWAVESSTLLPADVTARYTALRVTFNSWAAAHIPAAALPLVRTFAGIALSPLLYLGLAAVLLAEHLLPADREQQPLSRGMVHDGVAWFLLDALLKGFAYTACLGLVYLVLHNYAPWMRIDQRLTARMPTWTLVLAAIMASDFLKWIHHWLSHKIRFLWYFHSVHHSQRELNLFTQLRFHSVDLAGLVPIMYTPLYVLNLDFELSAWIILLTDWYGASAMQICVPTTVP